MTEDIVPVAFVSEDVARVSEIFFEFLDVGGHGLSVKMIDDGVSTRDDRDHPSPILRRQVLLVRKRNL
jgi:hypothetical protein